MARSLPVSEQYVQWYITELRRRELAEETARRLATDFLVFVSYSWADADVAHAVTEALDHRGIRYVQDRKHVKWGDRISEWAHEEINRSTHYLLILTKTSAASRWCAYEYGVAAGLEKGMLMFIADPELDIPPFAAGHAAVREVRDVESFFAKARIDEHEVGGFIEEMLDVRLEELGALVPCPTGKEAAWNVSDREECEQEQRSTAEMLVGDKGEGPERLLGIKLDVEEQRLTLEAKARHSRMQRYELSYAPELTAVVVIPKKDGSTIVGMLDDSEENGPRLQPGGTSVEDHLKGKSVYGWPASADFWAHTLRRLHAELPAMG
jgi:TIR domain-containing protein